MAKGLGRQVAYLTRMVEVLDETEQPVDVRIFLVQLVV